MQSGRAPTGWPESPNRRPWRASPRSPRRRSGSPCDRRYGVSFCSDGCSPTALPRVDAAGERRSGDDATRTWTASARRPCCRPLAPDEVDQQFGPRVPSGSTPTAAKLTPSWLEGIVFGRQDRRARLRRPRSPMRDQRLQQAPARSPTSSGSAPNSDRRIFKQTSRTDSRPPQGLSGALRRPLLASIATLAADNRLKV